ncbi:MAG: sigma-70 family RNA polymerase sigma factor [Bryobacterales bacterium]|nr:sigma-70 family RNA polymerase sigma factor [Bryobacterales bacterium]
MPFVPHVDDAESLTEIIRQASDAGGDAEVERMYHAVAPLLRSTAARYLRGERPDHTLQPTALLHDALLRLLNRKDYTWADRSHFLAAAAREMRRILARHARDRGALKRPGSRLKLSLLDADMRTSAGSFEQVLAINGLLDELAELDDRAARVVELAFFAGMHHGEIAAALGVSLPTVERDWAFARAWLYSELIEEQG